MSRRASEPMPSRRAALAAGVAIAVVTLTRPMTAIAETSDLAEAIAKLTKGNPAKVGRVSLNIPELAENGNAVGMTVDVQSPMTASDYVKTIHVLSEKNPLVDVVRFHLGPRAGRARVSTNIRLANTQRVVALAEMSDGSIWQGDANVIVTLAACIDAG